MDWHKKVSNEFYTFYESNIDEFVKSTTLPAKQCFFLSRDFLAIQLFQIVSETGQAKIYFTDNLGTPITTSILPTVIRTFYRSGSFFVHMMLEINSKSDNISLVTPNVNMRYIIHI